MWKKLGQHAIDLELLNGTQLNKNSIVILPLGSHEFHGKHAPLGTDSIIASELARRIAYQLPNTYVLPTVPYSFSTLHRDYPGTISIRAEVIISLLEDILCSLAQQGITRVLIINGHDGNVPCIDIATVNARHKYPACQVVATTWWQISKQSEKVTSLFGSYGGKGHGGAEEVALLMAIGKGQVDITDTVAAPILSITNRTAAPFLRHDITFIFQDMAEITGKSYEGVPHEATEEKGKFVLEYIESELLLFLREIKWVSNKG
jgi:creatinine amidohydrolase